MGTQDLESLLRQNSYPGRGVLLGLSPSGSFAVAAYFIMGRSANSRNRVFTQRGDGIITEAADESRMQDPSLILYAPVRALGDQVLIVTNGDQTDTIYDELELGGSFSRALRRRKFEPDAPNYTPRISGYIKRTGGRMRYRMSIIKSAGGNPDSVQRYFYEYPQPVAGQGHLIHTYEGDGNPLPSFMGEPRCVALPETIDELTDLLWNSLDTENKISLFVRYLPLGAGEQQTRICNRYEKTQGPAKPEIISPEQLR
jgi:phosphoribosylglycinamide formyltransferase-1